MGQLGSGRVRRATKIWRPHLSQRLIRSWWLLALCGVLDALISALYLVRANAEGQSTYHVLRRTILYLGSLTLAAGVCTLAAGVWSGRRQNSWLLILNGLACSALGAIFTFWTGPLAFRTVALLIVVMALSIGAYEFGISRASHRVSQEWLLGAVAVASVGFALAFLAFIFRWINLDPAAPAQSLNWLGAYFAFSAICMLVLILPRPAFRNPAIS